MTAARLVQMLDSSQRADVLALLGQRLGVTGRESYPESRAHGSVPAALNELMLMVWEMLLLTVGTGDRSEWPAREFVLQMREVAEAGGVLGNLEDAIMDAVRTIDARAR